MQRKQTRVNSAPRVRRVLDSETMRLSDLQLEFLELVGIQVTDEGRTALAAAARARLAADNA